MSLKRSKKPVLSWISFGFGSLLAVTLLYGLSMSRLELSAQKFDTRHYARISHSSTIPESWHQELPRTEPHIETPDVVRGIYLSAWTTGSPLQRKRILNFIKKSETINAVVIDIKDSTGIVSYTGSDPTIKDLGVYSKRIRNLPQVIKEFHDAGIYVIGRVACFEDYHLGKVNDDYVLKDLAGDPWYGSKGTRTWVDPANTEYHEYLVRLAREAHGLGVDEINFDYVRYPSEGNLKNIYVSPEKTKQAVITNFFVYLDQELRVNSVIPISADVFGLTTTGTGDMGIGQVWENIIPYVDYISPMIYPSHYAPGSFGYTNPAEFPSEIITRAIEGALEKTLKTGEPIAKIRPWIQDFNLGAQYGATEVRAQIKALEELGGGSYLSWDPRNIYTQGAYTN